MVRPLNQQAAEILDLVGSVHTGSEATASGLTMTWATYASIKDALVTQTENLQKLVNAGIGDFFCQSRNNRKGVLMKRLMLTTLTLFVGCERRVYVNQQG
jgi:hypothetical protein